jgi:signal transduction histidine kinase
VATEPAATPAPAWADELLERATAVAFGATRAAGISCLPPELARRIAASEERAATITSAAGGCEEGRRTAALEFVAEAVASLVLENAVEPGDVRRVVANVGSVTGVSPGAAWLSVFLRTIATRDVAQLPPRLAMDFLLDLLLELGPAEAVSLWTVSSSGRLECAASTGEAPGSRRLRTAARAVLNGEPVESTYVRAAVVERWDKPFAAVVARGRPETAARLAVYLRELASALTPLFERDMLFERHAARERSLVSGGERRLVRLGFDLHDGPLQEIVAFAEDLRIARSHIEPLLGEVDRNRAAGCFDDLGARLASLDRDLRQLAHSVRSTTALERPLEEALRGEVDALTRYGIETNLDVSTLPRDLTDSQKIVIYRVVQEALNNVRKHSEARTAHVGVRTTRRLIEVVVSDDGRGIDGRIRRQSDRLGLAGMHERVRLLGGVVTVGDGPSGGTLVFVTLPRWRARHTTSSATYAAGE